MARRTYPETWADDNRGYLYTGQIGKYRLRCYSGQWCVQTMEGGWRSALWLGVVSASQLASMRPVDHTPGPSALPGQQSLLQEEA